MVKNLPANAGDMVLIPKLRRSPGEGHGNPSSIFVWETPWTGEPGGLQSRKESDTTERLNNSSVERGGHSDLVSRVRLWRPCGLQPSRLLCPGIFQARILERVPVPPPGERGGGGIIKGNVKV